MKPRLRTYSASERLGYAGKPSTPREMKALFNEFVRKHNNFMNNAYDRIENLEDRVLTEEECLAAVDPKKYPWGRKK